MLSGKKILPEKSYEQLTWKRQQVNKKKTRKKRETQWNITIEKKVTSTRQSLTAILSFWKINGLSEFSYFYVMFSGQSVRRVKPAS
jgi:hypothetical protein